MKAPELKCETCGNVIDGNAYLGNHRDFNSLKTFCAQDADKQPKGTLFEIKWNERAADYEFWPSDKGMSQ